MTGSPFAPVDYKGVTYTIGQANNALLYPGFGLGAVVCQAERITMGMLSAAANAVANLVDTSVVGAPLLPKVADLQHASLAVATAVVKQAVSEKLNTITITDAETAVREKMWEATYH